MQYRHFGRTGCKVSALGFGCMRLPLTDPAGKDVTKIDMVASDRLLRSALEQGVNYFDTAYPYHEGRSEGALGKIMAGTGRRKDVYLATKMPTWFIQSREDMEKYFGEQCQRLQTEYIDFYLIHTLNKVTWPRVRDLGVIDYLEGLKRQGRVRHFGFSFHDDAPVFMDILDVYNWDFVQIQYNYLDENFQAGTAGFQKAVQRGMGMVIMEPLRGGNLARKPPENIQKLWDAAPVRRTPAEWALRWLLDKAGVSVILSGMNAQEQLDENCRVASAHEPGSLTAAEVQTIEAVRDVFHSTLKVPCTACNYCMPCPAGVNIPAIFNIYNQYGLFRDEFWCNGMYNFSLASTGERADNCVACGQCEESCPQHIEIIERLREAHGVLDSIGAKSSELRKND